MVHLTGAHTPYGGGLAIRGNGVRAPSPHGGCVISSGFDDREGSGAAERAGSRCLGGRGLSLGGGV